MLPSLVVADTVLEELVVISTPSPNQVIVGGSVDPVTVAEHTRL